MNHWAYWMAWRRSVTTLLVGGILSMLVLTPVAATQAGEPGWLARGVVVDEDVSLVFVMESGQLAARRVGSGELVWNNVDLIEPLGLHDGRLLVMGSRSRRGEALAYWLDPATGELVAELPWTLPEDVVFLIEARPVESFTARSISVDGDVILSWEYLRYPLRGAPAIAGFNRPPKAPRVSLPAQARAGGVMAEPVMENSIVHHTGMARVMSDRVRNLDPSDPISPSPASWQELHAGSRIGDQAGRQFRSSRGGAILVSQHRDEPPRWLRYQWILIGEDGSVLGRIESPFSFAPFAVVDRLLLHVASPFVRMERDRLTDAGDLALVVVNLADGAERWRINLLDLAHRGPLPP